MYDTVIHILYTHTFYVDLNVHIKYILQAEAWTLFVCLQASFSTHINQLRVNGPDNRVGFPWVQLEDTLGLVQEENKRIDNPINVHAHSLAFLCPKVCSVSNIACWIIQNTSSVLSHLWDIPQVPSSFSRVPGSTERNYSMDLHNCYVLSRPPNT